MKKLLAILLFLMPVLASAQYITPPCATTEVMKELTDRDASVKQQMEQLENILQQKLYEEYKKNGNKPLTNGPVYTIPVVVHIIYTSQTNCTPSALNITDTEIRNAFDHVNASFNARPAGKKWGQARYVSPTDPKYNPDSAGIKFCLATKGYAKGYDPTGTSARTDYPGGAIMRYDGNAAATWAATSNPSGNSALYVASGVYRSSAGVPEADLTKVGQWPLDKYYNVYLISQLDGNKGGNGTQGFAYFPSSGASDRAVMLIKDFSNSGDASTFTHEEGHALNLYHPFANNGYASSPTNQDQGGTQAGNCGPTETNHATQGDYVTDTPQCEGSLGYNCSSSYDAQTNPCDPTTKRGDYFHNWMTYGNCANMFTAGQVARMRTTLTTSGTNRFKQAMSTNITYCGCDGNNKPAAIIYVNNTTPCIGSTVAFTDTSLYNPTSRTWTVTPGTFSYVDATSATSKYPHIQFTTTGPYTVKLVAQNANGKDSATVTINPQTAKTLPLVEGFESATYPPTGGWKISNPVDGNDVLWARTTTASGFAGSTASSLLQNSALTGAPISDNSITSPPIDFSTAANPAISFDVAYQNTPTAYGPNLGDSLIVYYSLDCGTTFARSSYQKNAAQVATKQGTSADYASPLGSSTYKPFVPTAAQWRKDTVIIPEIANKANVLIRFTRGASTSNGASGNLYIDNINIKNLPPKADFVADRTTGCTPLTVNFTDKSTLNPTTWSWDFGDASPLVTTQNPTHTYSVSGTYTVKLTVTNAGGTDTKTAANYITVLNPAALPFIEGFESTTFTPNGWTRTNPVVAEDVLWARTTTANGFGGSTACAYLVNGSNVKSGPANNELTSPPINCSTATNPVLTFSVAYRKTPFSSWGDSLTVLYSTDCGATFTPIFQAGQNDINTAITPGNASSGASGDYLATGGADHPFKPTSTEWLKETVSLPVAGMASVVVKFVRGGETQYGYADNLYLDDINISNLSLPPVADFTADKTSACVGDVIKLTDQSSNNPTSWNWTISGATPSSSTAQNPTITYNTPGTYSVSLVSKNASGSSPIKTKTNYITISALPNASVTPGAVNLCKGSNVTLNGNGGTSYVWNTADNTQSITVSPTVDATYSVTVTNAGGCTASNIATVSVKPVPVADAGSDAAVCPGGSATIGAVTVSGNTYTWTANPAAGVLPSTAQITVTPAVTTTYTVLVTNGTGCTATDVAVVTIYTPPSPVITTGSGTTSVCGGLSTTLTSSSASSYKWSNAATTNSITVSPTTNTTYKVTVTDANTCTGSASVLITVNGPVANFSNTNVCFPDPIDFTDLSTGGPVAWAWDFDNNGTTDATTQNVTGYTGYPGPGTYTATLKVTDAGGCFTTISKPVNLGSGGGLMAKFSADKVNICLGDTIHFTDKSSGTPSTWGWDFDNNGSVDSTTQNPSFVYTAAGLYDVRLTVSNACGTDDSLMTFYINVNGIPVVDAGAPQSTCANVSVQLGGPFTAQGGSGTYTYAWSPAVSLDDPTIANPNATPTVNTTYTILVTDGAGCSASATTDVTVVGSGTTPSVTPSGPTTFCKGGSVDLTASAGTSYAWSNGGATTQTITVSPAVTTTYTVTITGSCGPQTASQIITVYATPNAVINPPGTIVICSGGSRNLVGPPGAASYLWSDTQTGQVIPVSTPGSYTLTVTDANGCTAVSPPKTVVASTATATITSVPNPPVICPGSSATLTANTGNAYLWSDGRTSKVITTNAAGTFTVDVTTGTGQNACTVTSSPITVSISSAAKPTITSSRPSNNLCTGDSLILTANTGSGATGYLWSPGNQTTPSITVKTSGNYSVAVTYGSCTRTSDLTSVTVSPAPSATITTNPASGKACKGDTVTLTASSTTAISSYLWSPGGATTPSIKTDTTGTYTVTIKSISGCAATSTPKNVSINALPTPTITSDRSDTLCFGETVKLSSSTGNSYLWHPTLETTDFINVNTTGTFYVDVTDINGCKASTAPVHVLVNQLPVAAITSQPNSATICEGDTVHLIANYGAGYKYKWSTGTPPKTTQEITVTTQNVYNVTVTDINNCSKASNSINVTVREIPNPVIVPNGPTHFCDIVGSVDLSVTAGAGYIYQWYKDGVAISGETNYTYTATATGSYTIKVTNTSTGANGQSCNLSKVSDPVVVTVDPQPRADNVDTLGKAFLCSPTDSVILVVNNSNGTSFQWFINANPIPNATKATYVVKIAGTYKVEVTNACGTKASLEILIKSYNPIVAKIDTLSPTTFCPGGNVVLYAQLGQDYTYQWKKDGFVITGATTQSYNATTSGLYTVVVSNPCTSVESQPIKVTQLVIPTLTVTAAQPEFCIGQSVLLHGDITGNYTNVQWQRYNADIPGATSTDYAATQTGIYTLVVFHTCGASVRQDVKVDAKPLPVFTVSPAPPTTITICRGSNTSFAVSNNPTDSVTWSTGSHQNNIIVNSAGNYYVTVKGINGCSLASAPITVNVDESVHADFTATPKPNTNPTEIQFFNKSSSNVNYTWNFGDNSVKDNSENPVHAYNNMGTFPVKLLIVNPLSQCTDSITKDVVVKPGGMIMPNVFTPNDDGKNDFFKLSDELKDYQFIKGEIFDRWGKKIYEWDSSNAKVGWNGKSFNGEDVADGVYFYIVKLKVPVLSISGTIVKMNEYVEQGSVTLFRK